MNWYLKCLKNYATFNGRARRKEYWMFTLVNMFVSTGLVLIEDLLLGSDILQSIYSLVVILPYLAVVVRRLHDVNKSGWWFFFGLIPLIGWIFMFAVLITEGDRKDNQYGPNPKNLESEIANA